MGVNFSGIDPRFAGARHDSGQLLAEIGAFIGRAESGAVADRPPRQAAVIGTLDDSDAADFLAQGAANDDVSGLMERSAPIIKLRANRQRLDVGMLNYIAVGIDMLR